MKHSLISDNKDWKEVLYKWGIPIVMLLGIAIRIYCVAKMPYFCSTHDKGNLSFDESVPLEGHFGYIQYIWRNFSLPKGNPTTVWGFYNPPFFYITQAFLWKVLSVTGIFYDWEWLEFFQWIPLCCSVICSVYMYMILKELKVKKEPLAIMTMLLFLHPVFIHFAINVTPDAMCMMFMTMAIYYTLVWYRKQTLKNIIAIALCIGFGMMTKISVALVAPGIGLVFLLVLFKNRERWKILCKQYVIFGCICVPIGLYWTIRNYILYRIPYNFVQRLSESETGLYLDPQKYSLKMRLGIPVKECLQSVHFDLNPSDQYNIWAEIFKSALVDEIYLKLDTVLYQKMIWVLFWTSVFLALILNLLLVYILVKSKILSNIVKVLLGTTVFVIMAQFILFCLDYPFTCTQSFRYIAVTLLFAAIGGGIGWEELKGKGGVIIKCGIASLMLLFGICSVWIYFAQIV